MVTENEALAIKTRVAPQLLALPGVTAVGLGSKETGGRATGELALKVFVTVKRPADQVAAAELIPAEIDGLPTDVIQSGRRHLVADPAGAIVTEHRDETRSRPLTGGRRIRREDSNAAGTMGCFLVDPAHPGTAYGLTNFHVMAAPDVPAPVAGTSAVGQPTGKSSVTGCCNDLFGKYAGGEMADDGKDEAAIKLDPGTQWLAEIADIGIITGSHEITLAEATPQTYKARKRGARTLLTGGVVTAVNTSDGHSDNDIVIKPNPNPAAGTRTVFFDYEGDSGSAVVNDAGEVVGLIYSRDDSGNGYAYAIDHVLERLGTALSVTLNVAVAVQAGVVNTVPGAAMVATPAELAAQLGPAPRPVPRPVPVRPGPVPAGAGSPAPLPVPAVVMPASLERDLNRSATGRLLITTWLTHQRELLGLINTNRRVALAWHRTGLSALVQVLARMPADPDLALPATLHGQPVRTVLTRIRATLDRFASPGLSADLDRLDRTLPDLGGLTYPRIIAALGTD
jgi:hypothetical protein